ncbi:peptidoglycan recognition protein family protein [Kitasatospora sp. KL5]|uniref:peptidoglycan recognition protein family protein n=1 Tax=Kitasatospora sp. KL5 TaxID=3425125 RepID=UPI003D6FC74C
MRLERRAALAAAATTTTLLLTSLAAVPAHARPAPGGVTTVPLESPSQRGADTERGLAPRTTRTFALVGLSWDDPSAVLDGGVQVRTRSALTGAWGPWYDLEAEQDDRPDEPTGRGATAPLWVGPSDGVAVRVTAGSHPFPSGLRAELVDPGTDPAGLPDPRPAEPAPRAAGAAPRPGIVTRAGWGADESIRESGFVYTGDVRAVFVHHTDTANDYSCSDAPKIIRSIYQYHVKSLGWRDIGYNFLVDRCGTIYEGRAGGVAEPVQGAHTLGFNTNSAGVAALGSYVSVGAPEAQVDGVTQIAAWKLGLTGKDARGTATLVSASDGSKYKKGTSVKFNAISGHRDAFNTECPGEELYARLGDIRDWAATLQGR